MPMTMTFPRGGGALLGISHLRPRQRLDRPSRISADDRVWRDIFGDDAPTPNDAAVSDRHAGQDDRVEADPDVVADAHGFCFTAVVREQSRRASWDAQNLSSTRF